MSYLKNLPLILFLTALVAAPINAYSMDVKRELVPLVEMLQEGKARISPDKKSIIDENGHIIGKESTNLDMKKYQAPQNPLLNPTETAKDNAPPPPQLFICTKKCAMITRHCYLDENENAVCISVCDKESLICN